MLVSEHYTLCSLKDAPVPRVMEQYEVLFVFVLFGLRHASGGMVSKESFYVSLVGLVIEQLRDAGEVVPFCEGLNTGSVLVYFRQRRIPFAVSNNQGVFFHCFTDLLCQRDHLIDD